MRSLRAQALAQLARELRLSARAALSDASVARHPRRRAGPSRVFREHRPYTPGDDVRQLDWRAFARTGRPVIKRFEDEARLRLWVGLDAGPSLQFGEGRERKLSWLAVLAQALFELAVRQDDAAGLWLLQGGQPAVPPAAGAAQAERLAATLAAAMATPRAAAPELAPRALGALGCRRLPHRVVLMGDWLSGWCEPAEPSRLCALLRALRALGHAVDVVQVLHPHELDFPFDGPVTFAAQLGPGGSTPTRTDATQARAAYGAALSQFRGRLEATCAEARVRLFTARSNESMAPLLRRLIGPAPTPAQPRVSGL